MAARVERLRRENEILQQEREILKRAQTFFAKEKSMRFRLIDAAKKDFASRLCKVLDVSASGYLAWKERPACRRQRDDRGAAGSCPLGLHPFEQDRRRPRMVHELRDNGLTIGRRRVARLMRENGLRARQKRRFKRTTDEQHAFPIAPNLLDQDFAAAGRNQKWAPTSPTCGPARAGSTSPSSSTYSPGASSGWATSDRLHKELALSALRRAIAVRRRSPASFTTRTAAASTAPSITRPTRKNGILISMSRKGKLLR